MDRYNFYNRKEMRRAKKSGKKIDPVFSLTGDMNFIKHMAKICELFDDFIWVKE